MTDEVAIAAEAAPLIPLADPILAHVGAIFQMASERRDPLNAGLPIRFQELISISKAYLDEAPKGTRDDRVKGYDYFLRLLFPMQVAIPKAADAQGKEAVYLQTVALASPDLVDAVVVPAKDLPDPKAEAPK